ncbi:hypothetical protein [Dactylosporangium sp. NPDC051484]|uniref:hypothetical protein n=1 Tax=Dactylosporangium sp. NPDC051484 TaxID=3154942 RepID=UPI00344F0B1E
MKRFFVRAVLIVSVVLSAAGIGSVAHAGAPGYTRQGLYGWPDQCAGTGYVGQQNHQWTSYYCETITATNWNAPGLYALWVA